MAQRWPAAWPFVAFLGFAVLALFVYREALHGPLVSDDFGYITANPYTASLSTANVAAILDPRGDARLYTANYAPVHLLLHALERQIFADDVLGYHLVGVLVHAANAALLAALLAASGVPRGWALWGGALFAVHPANVEAVAWISQLKTHGALALTLAALLAWRRRPGLASLLFGLALLTKASAACALPMAAAFTWARGGGRREWTWLGVWTGILVLYAIPQLTAIGHLGGVEVEAFADPWVQLRTIAAVGARYLAMAATGYGVSPFQEPPPALSWLDPWWLAALPAALLLGWRTLRALGRRREEAAWWIGAAAAFAPVSQLFPFLNPVADRYLYFILPGLIGGTLLALADTRRETAAPWRPPRLGEVAAASLAVFFAFQASAQVRLWQNETFLYVDAALHYPDGSTAHFLRARRAARDGDVETAVAALQLAAERGLDTWLAILGDPGFAGIRGDPAFVAVIREIAGRWLAVAERRGYATQPELRKVAQAHLVREEFAEAEAALEAALRAGGPLDEELRAELARLRAQAARGVDGSGREGDRDRTPRP
jgi:tetratricopeptide (TPR) repeat protein